MCLFFLQLFVIFHLFDSYLPFHPFSIGPLVQIAAELAELKIQLQTKDTVISDLELELKENLQEKPKVNRSTLPDLSLFTKD